MAADWAAPTYDGGKKNGKSKGKGFKFGNGRHDGGTKGWPSKSDDKYVNGKWGLQQTMIPALQAYQRKRMVFVCRTIKPRW